MNRYVVIPYLNLQNIIFGLFLYQNNDYTGRRMFLTIFLFYECAMPYESGKNKIFRIMKKIFWKFILQ